MQDNSNTILSGIRPKLELYNAGSLADNYKVFLDFLRDDDFGSVINLFDIIKNSTTSMNVSLVGGATRSMISHKTEYNDIDLFFEANTLDTETFQRTLWDRCTKDNMHISLGQDNNYLFGRPLRKDNTPAVYSARLKKLKQNYSSIDLIFQHELPKDISSRMPIILEDGGVLDANADLRPIKGCLYLGEYK